MSNGPDPRWYGGEQPPPYPDWTPPDRYPPVDYPANYGLPPPVYPPPYPGALGGWPYQDPYDPFRPVKPPGTNGMAIAAFVTALAGLVLCGLPSIVGLFLGIAGIRETRRTGQDGFGLALTGTIIGGLAALMWLIYLLAFLTVIATGG